MQIESGNQSTTLVANTNWNDFDSIIFTNLSLLFPLAFQVFTIGD